MLGEGILRSSQLQDGRLSSSGCARLAQVYYTTPAKKSEGVKGYWCHSCYSEHRGEVIELEGMRVRKVAPHP